MNLTIKCHYATGILKGWPLKFLSKFKKEINRIKEYNMSNQILIYNWPLGLPFQQILDSTECIQNLVIINIDHAVYKKKWKTRIFQGIVLYLKFDLETLLKITAHPLLTSIFLM